MLSQPQLNHDILLNLAFAYQNLIILPSQHIHMPSMYSYVGLLLAVERDIYPSVTSGMDRVIDIFINDVIKKLIRDRHFRIYIHPVVPVLGNLTTLI